MQMARHSQRSWNRVCRDVGPGLACVLLALLPAHSRQRSPCRTVGPTSLAYDRLPLSFEPNLGQTDGRVDFLAHMPGGTLFLTPGEATLLFSGPSGARHAVRMRFAGARSRRGEGLDPLPGTASYLLGSDPRRWRSGLPTYGRVAYRAVYPGVDVVYRGNNQRLEYDLLLAPGADLSQVRVGFEGARSIRMDEAGDLHVASGAGELVQLRPQVYQEVNGTVRAIAAQYALNGRGEVVLTTASYDRSRSLLVDPVLSYATLLGSGNESYATGVAVSAAGQVYLSGFTSSTFPTTAGALQESSHGGSDAFVAKLSAGGTRLAFSTYLGGTGDDVARSVALDRAGDVYVAGETTSRDFPASPGALQSSFAGGPTDAFVAKLNGTGTGLLYATYLGGTGGDAAHHLAVDSAGSAYVAGDATSTDFPSTRGALQRRQGGRTDGFVAKLNGTATALVYATLLGGAGDDHVAALAVDSAGSALVAGKTTSPAFAAPLSVLGPRPRSGAAAPFVAKVNADGSALVYAAVVGGTGDGEATGLAVDGRGSAYVVGSTASLDFPTTSGAWQATHGGGVRDAFLAKLDASGRRLVYATYLGGDGEDGASAVAVDGSDRAYVTGHTASRNFPTTPTGLRRALTGGFDAFVARLSLSPRGMQLDYGTYLGGSGDDFATGIALDGSDDAYVVGHSSSTDLPTTAGVLQPGGSGGSDGFVAELIPRASGFSSLKYCTYLGGAHAAIGYGLAVDASGNAYLAGRTSSTDFPTTPGALAPTARGGYEDAFVAKLDATGSSLVYSTYLGGTGEDVAYAIAVDGAGRAHVAGSTTSTDFPVTHRAFQRAHGGGGYDGFVATLNAGGTALDYATYLGGRGSDLANGLAVDASGDTYVVGYSTSAGFPTTATAAQGAFGGGAADGFAAKLTPGGALAYSTYLGGSGNDYATGVAVDRAGSAYVTGNTTSANFPVQRGLQPRLGGGNDAFVAKLSPGGALAYSTYLGGSGNDYATGVAVDGAGSAYVTGNTASDDFPVTPGALQRRRAGGYDAYLAKLGRSGARLEHASYLGGRNDDVGQHVAVDDRGAAYVVGTTGSEDFPTTPTALQPRNAGANDAFVAVLDASARLAYGTYVGGSGDDEGRSVALDGAGHVFLGGSTVSADFPTSSRALRAAFGGTHDAFVVRLPEVRVPNARRPRGTLLLAAAVVLGGLAALSWRLRARRRYSVFR